QELHVAGVGGLAVERVMTQRATAQLLADQGKLEQTQAHPAPGSGELGGPPAPRLDLAPDRLQGRHQLRERPRAQPGLEGVNRPLQEFPDRGQGSLYRFGDREVHPGTLRWQVDRFLRIPIVVSGSRRYNWESSTTRSPSLSAVTVGSGSRSLSPHSIHGP